MLGYNELWANDPFREMDRIQREMNRLFNGYSRPTQQSCPLVNIYSKSDAAIVTMEMAGFEPDNVDLSVRNNMLTIEGNRTTKEPDKELTFHRQERTDNEICRTIELPFNVESEKVEANFSNGILTITLPRAEADKPKKIKVKTS